jgi:hypothetical protein
MAGVSIPCTVYAVKLLALEDGTHFSILDSAGTRKRRRPFGEAKKITLERYAR